MKYKVGRWIAGMMVDRFDSICDDNHIPLIFDNYDEALSCAEKNFGYITKPSSMIHEVKE